MADRRSPDHTERPSVIELIFAPVLAVLSFLYALVMKVRVWFYTVGVLPSDSSGAFVVAIGNLQAGGTGKTPITEFFARRWASTGLRLGIVSRGYNRRSRGSLRVDPALSGAAIKFGDEPTWLAQALANLSVPTFVSAPSVKPSANPSTERFSVPVQVGEVRLAAARDLIASEGVKLILLDDGFQHLALMRSFDIVLVDVTAPSWHWRVIPWGRLREPATALRRADAVLLTKTEGVSSEKLSRLEAQVQRWAGSDRRSFDGKTVPLPILRFSQSLSWGNPIAGERLIVAAGLARPEAFFEMVRRHASAPNVVQAISFRDHHEYTEADVTRLTDDARTNGARRVLVTEKDAVKLQPLWNQPDIELVVSKLDVHPSREFDEKQLERLDEIILTEVRRGSGRSRGNGR